MAQQKKQATLRRRRLAVRGKSRKISRTARGKTGKQPATKPMPKKRLAKAKPRRRRGEGFAEKRAAHAIPVRETVIVDVIEEPVPGVITVTEFEETDVREARVHRAQPEED